MILAFFETDQKAICAADVGADWLFPKGISCVRADAGPGGNPGLVCVGAREDSRGLAYEPEKQTWARLGEGAWIGYRNDERPTPLDFLTVKDPSGYPVTMGDGQQWFIPRVLATNGRVELPLWIVTDRPEDAAMLISWARKYQAWRDSTRALLDKQGLEAEPPRNHPKFDIADAHQLIIRALRINYGTMGGQVAGLLALLSPQALSEALAEVAG